MMPFEESKDYAHEELRNDIFNYESNYNRLNSLNNKLEDINFDLNEHKYFENGFKYPTIQNDRNQQNQMSNGIGDIYSCFNSKNYNPISDSMQKLDQSGPSFIFPDKKDDIKRNNLNSQCKKTNCNSSEAFSTLQSKKKFKNGKPIITKSVLQNSAIKEGFPLITSSLPPLNSVIKDCESSKFESIKRKERLPKLKEDIPEGLQSESIKKTRD